MFRGIFGFGSPATIAIELEGAEQRLLAQTGQDENAQNIPIVDAKEDISGRIVIESSQGKRVDHLGVKAELFGEADNLTDRSSPTVFHVSSVELEPLGFIEGTKIYAFKFGVIDKPWESFYGVAMRIRYYIRVTVSRSYAGTIVKEQDIYIQQLAQEIPLAKQRLKMEVGIEDCLHIEFDFNKLGYSLRDVIIGHIHFRLVRIRIRSMELNIIRREIISSGDKSDSTPTTVARYELMDGAPAKGESIPVRLFLSPCKLTPSFQAADNKFTVKYFLSLVLVDEEDRRYFKQQEISLFRQELG